MLISALSVTALSSIHSSDSLQLFEVFCKLLLKKLFVFAALDFLLSIEGLFGLASLLLLASRRHRWLAQ